MLIQQFTTAMLLVFYGEGAEMAKSSFNLYFVLIWKCFLYCTNNPAFMLLMTRCFTCLMLLTFLIKVITNDSICLNSIDVSLWKSNTLVLGVGAVLCVPPSCVGGASISLRVHCPVLGSAAAEILATAPPGPCSGQPSTVRTVFAGLHWSVTRNCLGNHPD